MAQAPAAATNGGLKGNAPKEFTGDHDQSEKFLHQFDIYRTMNEQNDLVHSPYQ